MKKRISIIIFTILLIIIRLLNINSYVSLACGFGLLYEIIIGYSYLLKKKLNKKLCQTIPISIICIVIVITIFGLFNLLLPGAIILYALGIISFIYLYIKEEFKILDIFNEKGMLFYTIMFVLLMAANYFVQFNVWDEYTYWSIASKHYYLTNTINLTKMNTMPYGTGIIYPPNPTIFQYFCMKLFGSYRQGFELFASQIMGFALLLPLFKNLKTKTGTIIVSIICLFIPAIFADAQFYYTIYVDCLLGLLTGYTLFEYCTNDNKKYKNLISILGVIICALTKASGFMFSLIILIFCFVDFILKKLNNKEKIKEIIYDVLRNKMFYMMFILTMFVFLGWRIYCNSIDAIDDYRILENTDTSTITSVSHLLKSIIGSLTGYGYDTHSEIISKFFLNFFDYSKYTKVPMALNLTTILFIFALSLLLLYINSKNKNDVKNYSICLFFSTIIYILLLQLSYLVMFSPTEALNANSSQRYVGSILIANLLLIVGLYLNYYKNSNNEKKLLLILLLIITLFTPLSEVAKGTIFSGTRNYYSISYLRREKKLANIIKENVDANDKVTAIAQSTESNSLIKVIYFATPIKVINTIKITEDNYERIDYGKVLNESKYIVTIDIDDFIIKKIKKLYNITLEPYTLYKIENNKMIKIKRSIIDFEDSNEIGYIKGDIANE